MECPSKIPGFYRPFTEAGPKDFTEKSFAFTVKACILKANTRYRLKKVIS